MTSQSNLSKFNRIYDETYFDILKYIIIKCHNINDANDILQETYLELWKILNKRELEYDNINSFLIGIAINKIKKHYTLLARLKSISLSEKNDKDIELSETIKDNIDIETLIINKDNWNRVWQYIKNMKNQDIPKIFYLYYKLELSIKEIAKILNKNESYIKNLIYRTLNKLSAIFRKDI